MTTAMLIGWEGRPFSEVTHVQEQVRCCQDPGILTAIYKKKVPLRWLGVELDCSLTIVLLLPRPGRFISNVPRLMPLQPIAFDPCAL